MKKPDERPDQPKPKPGISRRKFLKGVSIGGGVLGSGILGAPLLTEEAEAQGAGARIIGPGAVPMELTVNGQRRTLQLEPRITLLEALRDWIELTGAKKVCDRASCGACTVLLDGMPVYSCSVLAIEAQGKIVQTVEGLAQDGTLHALQTAFIQNDAQQCGFCTSGMVMAAKACLDKHPHPTAEQIRMNMGGNLCRCGTYVGVAQAIRDVANRNPAESQSGQGGANARL